MGVELGVGFGTTGVGIAEGVPVGHEEFPPGTQLGIALFGGAAVAGTEEICVDKVDV
jgi:hypothetical protein